MKKNVLVIATFVFMGVANGVNAANEPKEKVDTVRTYALQDVEVVSTRATSKTPMAFETLDQKQIKAANFGQDIPYLLSLTPSVTITSDTGNGIGYTSIRVRGADPSRINVTANGIPINDAESAQPYWVDMGDFASSLQSLQIQRGVGTSTNGAGAFGATLNMQTENIGAKPFIGLDVSGGSYYSHKETFRFGTGLLGGHWGFQGRLSNIGSKGYLDRASAKLSSYFLQGGYFSDNTMIKFITFNGIENTYHAWNYASKYEQSLYGRTYNSCGEYYDAEGNVHYYNNQIDYFLQQNYQLIWNQIFSKNLTLNVALHYTKGYGYYEEYKSGATWAEYNLTNDWDMYGDLVRRKANANDFYGAIASVNYDNHKGLNLVIGGGWNKFDGGHHGNVLWTGNGYDADNQPINSGSTALTPDFEYYNNKGIKVDGNIYGKATWEFYKGLDAFVDMQYRHINYKMNGLSDMWDGENNQIRFDVNDNFDFFNPKFGLNWSLSRNHRLYASYSIAHKEPVRNDYEDNLDSDINGEQLNDLEFGYQYKSPKFSAGANFYYMYYRNQFVLTGELNDIGEMISSNDNSGRSYRMGAEITAAWQPVEWFRWDANATFSRNIAKDWTVTLDDGQTENLGNTHLSFSPDLIFNNIFTFKYKAFTANIQSQYVGNQYLTNTNFKSYTTQDDNENEVNVGMMIDDFFTTNINLAYNFSIKRVGIKDATVGISLYNIFNSKYDNNGWAAPGFKKDASGKVVAYADYDQYEAGFAPSAPFNFMAHLSVNF